MPSIWRRRPNPDSAKCIPMTPLCWLRRNISASAERTSSDRTAALCAVKRRYAKTGAFPPHLRVPALQQFAQTAAAPAASPYFPAGISPPARSISPEINPKFAILKLGTNTKGQAIPARPARFCSPTTQPPNPTENRLSIRFKSYRSYKFVALPAPAKYMI